LSEQTTVECPTRERPKNWYVPRRKHETLAWTTSTYTGGADLISRWRHHRVYRWLPQKSARLSCAAGTREPSTQFRALARQWKNETQYASHSNQMFLVPSYQRIIGLGPSAIPLILRELENEPGHWFWALAALTGENPAAQGTAGNVDAMREAWLQWGRERGYL